MRERAQHRGARLRIHGRRVACGFAENRIELGSLVGDHVPSSRALSATDRSFLRPKGAQEYMNWALVNLQATDKLLRWLDERVGALRTLVDPHLVPKRQAHAELLTQMLVDDICQPFCQRWARQFSPSDVHLRVHGSCLSA